MSKESEKLFTTTPTGFTGPSMVEAGRKVDDSLKKKDKSEKEYASFYALS